VEVHQTDGEEEATKESIQVNQSQEERLHFHLLLH